MRSDGRHDRLPYGFVLLCDERNLAMDNIWALADALRVKPGDLFA
jgi:hypothetical protein